MTYLIPYNEKMWMNVFAMYTAMHIHQTQGRPADKYLESKAFYCDTFLRLGATEELLSEMDRIIKIIKKVAAGVIEYDEEKYRFLSSNFRSNALDYNQNRNNTKSRTSIGMK